MQANPIGYFQKNRGRHILEKSNHDIIGVLSCCSSAENEPMWAHYGDNHLGFAVGLHTVELARVMQCTFGYVRYDDTPVDFHIFGDNSGILENDIFQKSVR